MLLKFIINFNYFNTIKLFLKFCLYLILLGLKSLKKILKKIISFNLISLI